MYEVRTNIYFDAVGEVQCDHNSSSQTVLGVFQREEDAIAFSHWVASKWLEAIHAWDVASESWKPLTAAQVDAWPSVVWVKDQA